MIIPKSVINYCNKHGILYEIDSDTGVEFKAPENKIFTFYTKYRVIDLYQDDGSRCLSPKQIIDLLYLYDK